MKPSISIIVPALNEERNIEDTIKEILIAVDERFSDFEILIFDDASSDNTGTIAEELAAKNKNIKVIHNEKTMGLGYNYKKGVELAKNDFIIMPPGDNSYASSYIERLFDAINRTDIIIGYNVNYWIRPLSRRIISKTFTLIMNLLFGLRIKYYNGLTIHKREIIRSLRPRSFSESFAYQAENLTLLIRSGYSYVEIPVYFRERRTGKSKAVNIKNILGALKAVLKLFITVYIRERKKYNRPIKKVELNEKYQD